MKTKLLLSALLSTLTLSPTAQAESQDHLEVVQYYFLNLNEFESENISVIFSASNSGAEELLSQSSKCSKPGAFKQVSKKKWVDLLMGEYSNLHSEILDMDDGYYSAMESLDEATRRLAQDIGNEPVEICTDLSTPDYSDKASLTFVSISGYLTAVHGFVYAD